MDPSGRAMRWNQPNHLVEFIREVSHRRVTMGEGCLIPMKRCSPDTVHKAS